MALLRNQVGISIQVPFVLLGSTNMCIFVKAWVADWNLGTVGYVGFSTGRGVVPGSWVQSMGGLEASGWADGWYSILGLSTVLLHAHTSQRHICQYAALWVLIVYFQADTAWVVSLTIDIEAFFDSSQVSYCGLNVSLKIDSTVCRQL